MRILMLNHNVAWSGGTYFRAYHFARQMVRRGHQVTLLTISPTLRVGFHDEVCDGLRVVETPDLIWGRGRSGWDVWDALSRVLYMRGKTWELVHAFDSRPVVILPALLLQRRGVPLVLDWADWWGRGGTIEERAISKWVRVLFEPVETYFEEAFRNRADGTTVISKALLARAVALGVPDATIVRIPQGSDTEGIHPLEKRLCRKELGFDERAPIVGYVGVLSRSDAQLLFEAFALLRRIRPDCQLLLIGNHKSRVSDRLGVVETGFVPHHELVKLMGACDIMLLPLKDTISNRGRWPSKINDYLAAGRPIVASAVGDMRRLFDRHPIGYAVLDTPASLAEAANDVLLNEALRDEFGRNARKVAEHELAWPILAEKLEGHYLSTIKRRQGAAALGRQKERRSGQGYWHTDA